jgi:hypothetical protein
MNRFCLLLKPEFISLLNNLEVIGIPKTRFFSEPNELLLALTLAPIMTFDEDYLVVLINERLSNEYESSPNEILNIFNITELIPLTDIAFLGYDRKFSTGMIWTHPSKYKFEDAFLEFSKQQMREDAEKNFNFLHEVYLLNEAERHINDDIKKEIIEASICKRLLNKSDLSIKENEFPHVYCSLMIYEQGSHFSRESAMGFLMHAVGVYILHRGYGSLLGLKINLNKSPSISALKNIQKKKPALVFQQIFEDQEILDELQKAKTKYTDAEFDLYIAELKTMGYFLFFSFLVDEKKIPLNQLFHNLEALYDKDRLSKEEMIAFQLLSLNKLTASLKDDFLIEKQDVKVFIPKPTEKINSLELIASYIIAKPDYKSQDTTTPLNEVPSYLKSDELIEKIRTELLAIKTLKYKNKIEKIEFFKTTLFPKYIEDLENAGYCLDDQNKLEEFYNKQIHSKRTRRR